MIVFVGKDHVNIYRRGQMDELLRENSLALQPTSPGSTESMSNAEQIGRYRVWIITRVSLADGVVNRYR